MLRRLPTALTISHEDIAAFEEAHAKRLAYLRIGEDPSGVFTKQPEEQQGAIDPNDELKPLPGDKARIVRGKEERIVGAGAGVGTETGARAAR